MTAWVLVTMAIVDVLGALVIYEEYKRKQTEKRLDMLGNMVKRCFLILGEKEREKK